MLLMGCTKQTERGKKPVTNTDIQWAPSTSKQLKQQKIKDQEKQAPQKDIKAKSRQLRFWNWPKFTEPAPKDQNYTSRTTVLLPPRFKKNKINKI